MKNLVISSLPIILALVITAVICIAVDFDHVDGIEMFFWVFIMVLLPVVVIYALVISFTKFGERYL